MPTAHAVLGPSGAHRWINCPGSIRVAAQVQRDRESTSPYAYEGNVAHALAEIEGRRAFGQITHKEYYLEYEAWRQAAGLDLDTLGDMEVHIKGFIDFLLGRMSLRPRGTILFEQRLSAGITGVWGTSDVIIYDASTIEVWDLKYGMGHPVAPEDNEQLMLYGLGALDTYGDILDDTTDMVIGIYQPRIPGGIRWWDTTPEYLRDWRERIARPAAALALTDDAPIVPSEGACRWCPAAGECEVRAKWAVGEDFGAPYVEVQTPDLLDAVEMSTVLDRIPAIEQWCKDVQEAALRRIYQEGKEIPGWKVVRSGGRRGITDKAAAIQTLIDAGFSAAEVARFDVRPLGELEKLIRARTDIVGVKALTLDDILGDLIQKSEGSISMVRESDHREAVNSLSEAQKDFS